MELHRTALLRRIVGTPTSNRWAQTLVLDEKVSPERLVMAVVEVSIASAEEDRAATVGKAILTHLETSLLGSMESVYAVLEQTLTTIPEHIPASESSDAENPTMSIVAGVLSGNMLTLGVIGHGRVMMRARGRDFVGRRTRARIGRNGVRSYPARRSSGARHPDVFFSREHRYSQRRFP